MQKYDAAFWTAVDTLIDTCALCIDRKKGSAHPRYPQVIYPLDYGYLSGTSSMDGSGIDVWIGSGEKTVDALICTVDLLKRDSEIKLLLGCTEEEKQMILQFHSEGDYMKGILVRRK